MVTVIGDGNLKTAASENGPSPPRVLMLATAGIVLAIVSIYLPVTTFSFLEYDDTAYVLRNPDLQNGLNWQAVKAVFTESYIASWHPVAMLSHALDVSLFGMTPGMHHAMNVFYHIVNSVLVLLVWYRLTGKTYQSAALAVLWAIHPQHVEPVAWISSRKDLVSTTFMLLALWSYHRYTVTRTLRSYCAVAIALLFGLLAKPMLVTLPFILLLLDYWPLNRLASRQHIFQAAIEKIPLFLLCAIFMVVTHYVQAEGGAVRGVEDVPQSHRLNNIPIAYAHYFYKAFYPTSLSIFYPHPMGDVDTTRFAAGIAALVLGSVAALVQCRRRPYLFVGWFWFLGSLVPVIGVIQFGVHGMADRYTYVAHLGLFTALVWLAGDIAAHAPQWRRGVAVSVLAVILLLSLESSRYLSKFKDDIVLFTHVEDVTGSSVTQIVNLGNGLMHRGAFEEALLVFTQGYDIRPLTSNLFNNAGVCYLQLGRFDLARDTFLTGMQVFPDDDRAVFNLQYAETRLWEAADAIPAIQETLEASPNDAPAMLRLAEKLYNLGRLEESDRWLLAAQAVRPDDPNIIERRGRVLLEMGHPQTAAEEFRRALELNGEPRRLFYWLARASWESGDREASSTWIDAALRVSPPSLNAQMLARRLNR